MRETEALDGLMARAIGRAGIQFRVLNRSKGPAVRGPRAQADRRLYRRAIAALLAGYLAEPAIGELLEPVIASAAGDRGDPPGWVDGVSFAVALAVATVLAMLFGELLPKNAALARPAAIAALYSPSWPGTVRSSKLLTPDHAAKARSRLG